MGKRIPHTTILIALVSLGIATLNIIRVLLGALQVPDGHIYLAIGHSYLDYLEYTQQISQGIFGHLLVENQFTVNDPTRTLIGWGQYLFIGYIAKIFSLSPFFAYWLFVFVFSFIALLVTFVLTKKILATSTFHTQFTAFLFAIFAAPFVAISASPQGITVSPVEFFYSQISLFHRLGGVPHHLTTTICMVLAVLSASEILDRALSQNPRHMGRPLISFIFLCVLLTTFAPLQVVSLGATLGVVSAFFIAKTLIQKRPVSSLTPLMSALFFIGITVIPFALFIKTMHGSGELFARAIAWERTQQYKPAPLEFLLSLGPIIVFSVVGLRSYLSRPTPIRLLMSTFTIVSYTFFFSDLAYFFGTFNQRFQSPLSYVFFGATAILGIQYLVQTLPWKRVLQPILTGGLLLYFTGVTLVVLQSFGPSNQLGYMRKDIITGIQTLNQQSDKKAVLTSSFKNLGLLVPTLIDRNVYLGRMIFTPEYEKRQDAADFFYAGLYDKQTAYFFLKNNRIGYILLTPEEPYKKETILQYPFIRQMYSNPYISIFQFVE